MMRWRFRKEDAKSAIPESEPVRRERPGVSDRTVFWMHFINAAAGNWSQAAHELVGVDNYQAMIRFRARWAPQLGPSAVRLLRQTAEEIRQECNHSPQQQACYSLLSQRLEELAAVTAWLMHEGLGDDLAQRIAERITEQQSLRRDFDRAVPQRLQLLNEDAITD
jgi:hypothetical protein